MSEKRYYWFRFHDDFFQDKRIKRLRQLTGGDTFTIIYLKMQLRALKTDGYLFFDEVLGDFYEEIALDIDENVDNVKLTIQYLVSVNLIEISPDGKKLFMPDLQKNIGSESASAQRVRDYRQKQKKHGTLPLKNNEGLPDKALQCNADVTKSLQCTNNVTDSLQCNADTLQSNAHVTGVKQVGSAEIEIEIEKDINISNTKALDILSDNEKNLSDEEEIKRTTKQIESIIEQWNTLEKYGIKGIRIVGPNTERGKMLRARLKQYGLDSFDEIVEQIKHSDFLQGKHDGRAWQIDFDWLVHPSNYPKVLEGKYRGRYNPQPVNGKARNFINFEQRQEDFEELEKMLLDN